MAGPGGWVQLDQSDIRLALNMAQMAIGGFLCHAIEETQQLLKKPCADVQEEMMCGVVCPGYNKVKAVIGRHPALVCETETDSSLSCKNDTAKNPKTCWRNIGTGAPPPRQGPPWPGMPPALSDNHDRTQCSDTKGVPPRYVYIYTPLHRA
jgi:hypothetical protein